MDAIVIVIGIVTGKKNWHNVAQLRKLVVMMQRSRWQDIRTCMSVLDVTNSFRVILMNHSFFLYQLENTCIWICRDEAITTT